MSETEMVHPSPLPGGGTMLARIRANPAFVQLEAERRSLAWALTAIILVVYYGFILLVAFDKEGMGRVAIGQAISTGLPLGLGVIVIAIVITGIYVWRANGRFDPLTAQVVAQEMASRPVSTTAGGVI